PSAATAASAAKHQPAAATVTWPSGEVTSAGCGEPAPAKRTTRQVGPAASAVGAMPRSAVNALTTRASDAPARSARSGAHETARRPGIQGNCDTSPCASALSTGEEPAARGPRRANGPVAGRSAMAAQAAGRDGAAAGEVGGEALVADHEAGGRNLVRGVGLPARVQGNGHHAAGLTAESERREIAARAALGEEATPRLAPRGFVEPGSEDDAGRVTQLEAHGSCRRRGERRRGDKPAAQRHLASMRHRTHAE